MHPKGIPMRPEGSVLRCPFPVRRRSKVCVCGGGRTNWRPSAGRFGPPSGRRVGFPHQIPGIPRLVHLRWATSRGRRSRRGLGPLGGRAEAFFLASSLDLNVMCFVHTRHGNPTNVRTMLSNMSVTIAAVQRYVEAYCNRLPTFRCGRWTSNCP